MLEPIHIHIESDEKTAKFWIEPITLASNDGYKSKKSLKLKNHLLSSWEEAF